LSLSASIKGKRQILGQTKVIFFREYMLRIESGHHKGMMDWGDDILIQSETRSHGKIKVVFD